MYKNRFFFCFLFNNILGFKPKPTIKGLPGFSLPLNVKLKKFKVSELTASTDRFQSMLDSNRGLDGSGSLHALSAKTAAGKVSYIEYFPKPLTSLTGRFGGNVCPITRTILMIK